MGNDLAALGRTRTLISAIVGTIVGLIFIGVGIRLIYSKNPSAYIFLGLGLLIIFMSWLFYYLTRTSDTFAKVEGISTLVNGFDSVRF